MEQSFEEGYKMQDGQVRIAGLRDTEILDLGYLMLLTEAINHNPSPADPCTVHAKIRSAATAT